MPEVLFLLGREVLSLFMIFTAFYSKADNQGYIVAGRIENLCGMPYAYVSFTSKGYFRYIRLKMS